MLAGGVQLREPAEAFAVVGVRGRGCGAGRISSEETSAAGAQQHTGDAVSFSTCSAIGEGDGGWRTFAARLKIAESSTPQDTERLEHRRRDCRISIGLRAARGRAAVACSRRFL